LTCAGSQPLFQGVQTVFDPIEAGLIAGALAASAEG
jgi:hypothetical protein